MNLKKLLTTFGLASLLLVMTNVSLANTSDCDQQQDETPAVKFDTGGF